MHLDGYDLTGVPLVERKRLLKELLEKADLDRIFYSEHFEDGKALYAQAAALGLEGVVSKKPDSLYKPSKSAWQKVKCVQSAEYHIVGYVPSGSRHIGALRLGQRMAEHSTTSGSRHLASPMKSPSDCGSSSPACTSQALANGTAAQARYKMG